MQMLIARNPEICFAELDGEICLFEPNKAEYLNLNKTGSEIWNLLEEPTEVPQLIATLLSQYDVDTDTCRQQTEAFISEALEKRMVLEQPLA